MKTTEKSQTLNKEFILRSDDWIKVELWNLKKDNAYCYIQNMFDPSGRICLLVDSVREIIEAIDEDAETNT